jgi:hypothetical protein
MDVCMDGVRKISTMVLRAPERPLASLPRKLVELRSYAEIILCINEEFPLQ